MDPVELAAWLRLLETPAVGRTSARRLLGGCGSAVAVFEATPAAWESLAGAAVAAALAQPPAGFDDLLTRTQAWLDGGTIDEPRNLLCLGDPAYPPALLNTADPPLLLYLQGQPSCLGQELLAIVGSRHPTPQGVQTARALSGELARHGLVIVSGLALGIDGAAHEAALEAGGGSIAVVGTGLDRVYPARHRGLAHRLAQRGLLISEYPLGTPPLANNFPQRNRIIAGLTRGTLVVEAALQSGSLITARLAAEAGRDVYAVPGAIQSLQSKGCHLLIKQGARLVESADDVLEELQWPGRLPVSDATDSVVPGPAGTAHADLLAALGHGPVTFDALSERTGRSSQDLGAALLDLELAGQVARMPGQLFQRIGMG
jgi:DNA processing protein